jgi:hypothetical protein
MAIATLKKVLNSKIFNISLFLIFFAVLGLDLAQLETNDLDFWFELHETFYLAAVFVSLLTLFSLKFKWASFLGLLLGFLSSFYGIFDEKLHPFLSNHVFSHPTFAGNPQHTKLIAYGLTLALLLVFLFFKKNRMQLILCTLLLLVNLFLVTNNHASYPDGIFDRLVQMRRSELLKLEEIKAHEVEFFCQIQNLLCRSSFEGKMTEYSTNIKLSKSFQNYYDSLKHHFETSSGAIIIDTNKTPSMYMSFSRKDGLFLEVFDPSKIREYWEMNAFYFYRNSSLVSGAWYLFFLVLGYLHRNVNLRKRKKL